MHSVRIELAKFILVGTRTTYQATGDAGFGCWKSGCRRLNNIVSSVCALLIILLFPRVGIQSTQCDYPINTKHVTREIQTLRHYIKQRQIIKYSGNYDE